MDHRVNLCEFYLVYGQTPGMDNPSVRGFEVKPALPMPLSQFLDDSFNELQLKLGVSLDALKDHPELRAMMGEKVLCAIEEYCKSNTINSEALSNFLIMSLLKFVKQEPDIGEFVWKKISVAAHYQEDEDNDREVRLLLSPYELRCYLESRYPDPLLDETRKKLLAAKDDKERQAVLMRSVSMIMGTGEPQLKVRQVESKTARGRSRGSRKRWRTIRQSPR